MTYKNKNFFTRFFRRTHTKEKKLSNYSKYKKFIGC